MIVRNYRSMIVHIDRAKYHSDAAFYRELVRVKFNIILRPSENGIENIRAFLKD